MPAAATIVAGGSTDDSEGYFVAADRDRRRPIRATGCSVRGAVRAGRDRVTSTTTRSGEDALELVDTTSPYALDRARSSPRDRGALAAGGPARCATRPGTSTSTTSRPGAVVGQQPFGGARASGTNDKAGSMWNLIRWVSPRTVKETFVPPQDYRYAFLAPDGP